MVVCGWLDRTCGQCDPQILVDGPTAMRKSTLIANCLVNAGMTLSIVSGEHEVERVFRQAFADEDFDAWNSHVNEQTAGDIVRKVSPATRVRVGQLIRDLWNTS